MNIYLSVLQDQKQHQIPSYRFWRDYFVQGIREAGHQWCETAGIDWAEGLAISKEDLPAWRAETWDLAVRDLKSRVDQGQKIDLFLSYLYPEQVLPAAVEDIRRLGIPVVNFYCDNLRDFRKIPKEFFCFDLNWVPEKEAVAIYQRQGLPVINAPMPIWVPPEWRHLSDREDLPATFIGSADRQRRQLLHDALSLGATVDIRGRGWLSNEVSPAPRSEPVSKLTKVARQIDLIRSEGMMALCRKIYRSFQSDEPPVELLAAAVKPYPKGEEYFDVLARATVALGVNRFPSLQYSESKPKTYSRLRDLEAPMIGACYLTEWCPGLEDLYDLGKEVETYRNAEEMADKIHMLQSDSHYRRRLRVNGQRRALSDHTVGKSLDRIALQLGLTQPNN